MKCGPEKMPQGQEKHMCYKQRSLEGQSKDVNWGYFMNTKVKP